MNQHIKAFFLRTLLTAEEINPVRFENLSTEIIWKVATKTKEGSGSSGEDAGEWRKIILSKSSGEISNNFCSELGSTAKKIYPQSNVPDKY